MGKFEEKWKKAFEDEGVEPPDSVWLDIDRRLANADSDSMKKRIILYQRIAAASVFFALMVGSLGIYYWNDINSQLAQSRSIKDELPGANQKIIADDNQHADLATSKNEKDSAPLNPAETIQPANDARTRHRLAFGEQKNLKDKGADSQRLSVASENKNKMIGNTMEDKQSQGIVSADATSVYRPGISFKEEQKPLTIKLNGLPEPELASVPEIHHGPVITEIIRILPAIPGVFMVRRQNKINHEKVWASASAAAGTFGSGSGPSGNAGAQATGSAPASGNSFSFAMLAGVRMARRVVLQSGIQYTNESTGSVVDAVPSTLYNINTAASRRTATPTISSFSSPYNISSTNEFVSVPVQAGYLFIDRRIGLQLNSGVSTDFFVRNTVSDPSGQVQSLQGGGQNSPYRAVNFSGLINSEVSCKLGSRYRISLVPGFRYSFNPVLKSDVNSLGNPWVLDVGFRFRYIFKG